MLKIKGSGASDRIALRLQAGQPGVIEIDVGDDDLTGTDVTDVEIDLAGSIGGFTGDGQADRIVVNATNGDDSVRVDGDAEQLQASGLAATVTIDHSEVANDRLEVNTLAGNDIVNAAGLAAGAIKLFVDGLFVA